MKENYRTIGKHCASLFHYKWIAKKLLFELLSLSHYFLFKSLQLYNIITAKAFALNLLRMSSVHWSHFQNLYPSCYTWARLWGEGVERESENEVIIGTNSRWVFTVLFSLYSDSLSQKLWKVKTRSYGIEMEIFQRKSRFPETSQSFLFVPSSRAFLVPTLLHKRETISWGAKFDYFWRTFILVHTFDRWELSRAPLV